MQATIISVLVAIVGIMSLWHATDGLQALTTEQARRISVTRERPTMPDVALQTMGRTTIKLHSPAQPVTLVEFIYTSCPSICQSAGAHLAQLRDQLISEKLENKVRILSISFDPKTDQISELASYGEAHNADGKIWTIARPLPGELPPLLDRFGVVIIRNPFGGYEHNAALHILDASGRLHAIIDIGDQAGALQAARKILQ